MKYTLVIAVIASLGAGFFIGKSQVPNPEIQIKEVEVIKEKKVEVVKEVPVIDKAGDEALAQAFTLFLAALGLEKIKVEESEVREIMKDPSEFIARNSIKKELEKKYETNNDKGLVVRSGKYGQTPDVDERVGIEVPKNWPIQALKDPTVFLAKSNVIKDFKTINAFNGSYEGQINFFAGKNKGKSHRLVMHVSFVRDEKDEIADGQTEIALYDENGKNYSTSRGTGGNRNFLQGEDGSFIVKVVDKTFFHFVKKSVGKFANYYEDGRLVGSAKLFDN